MSHPNVDFNKFTCNKCVHKDVCVYKQEFREAATHIKSMIQDIDDASIQHIFHAACIGTIACRKFEEEIY